MGSIEEKKMSIFETQASWSDANKEMLCLETGGWRTVRPIIDAEKCNRCGLCFIYCPTQCIQADEAMENYIPNLKFCKGCGVCAKECPTNVIVMTSEGDYTDE